MTRILRVFVLWSLVATAFATTPAEHSAYRDANTKPNMGTEEAAQLKSALTLQLARFRQQWGLGRTSVDGRGYPGIAFAYCLPDGRCESLAAGYSDLKHRVRMRGDDRFLAGSVGKTFVAAIMMQLVEEGRVGLDDRIADYLGQEPWFPRLANGPDITVAMLLAHRTGIGGTGNIGQAVGLAAREHPNRVWSHMDRLPLDLPANFPAGSQFEYRDENYDLAALLIEKLTGDSYYTEVSRRILVPLHLEGTYPQNNSSERHLPGVVNGYQWHGDELGLAADISTNGFFALSPSYEWGGGGLVSNAPDLARWARTLYGGRLLQDAILAQMLAPRSRSGQIEQYGLGTAIYATPWGVAYGHTGYMPGYRSAMLYLPRYDLGVALQTNTDYLVTSGTAHHMEQGALRQAIESMAEIIIRQHLQW